MLNDEGYPELKIARKTGREPFTRAGKQLDHTLLDFWRWSASDLVSNATRGILAEYIVASALGCLTDVRREWDAFDLLTPSGIKVEVKSAAYLQSWYHKKLSAISFSIRPTIAWSATTGESAAERRRQADVYVSCLLDHNQKDSLDPLDLNQWTFYVVRAAVLDRMLPLQKTISLGGLEKLQPLAASYDELAACVEKAGSNVDQAP